MITNDFAQCIVDKAHIERNITQIKAMILMNNLTREDLFERIYYYITFSMFSMKGAITSCVNIHKFSSPTETTLDLYNRVSIDERKRCFGSL